MTTNNSNSAAVTVEALANARRGFVDGVKVAAGSMRAYVAMLCADDVFGSDWVEAISSDSANAKPIKKAVKAEQDTLYAMMKADGYSNPSVYWGRVKADVPLYLAEKALEAAKVKAEGKPAKSVAAKRVTEAAAALTALKAGKAEKRKPAGAPATGEAPKAPAGKAPAGITLVVANAFIMAQLAMASGDKGTPFTPPLRRGLANLAEAIAAYFAANPMDKLEAAIAAKK
jgi:hypothetical protein